MSTEMKLDIDDCSATIYIEKRRVEEVLVDK
jgi:hypothetical protein